MKPRSHFVLCACLTLIACNGTNLSAIKAPSGLTYAVNPAVYTLNQEIANDTPSTSGGGAVVSYSIKPPALPEGLSFDLKTGIVSGTPRVLSPVTDYTVTATNTGGSTRTILRLSVVDAPPVGFAYVENPAVYTINQAITNNRPTFTGGGAVSVFTISPALPAGLLFDTTTGIISGTPTVLSQPTDYTVTATNTGGSAQVTLNISVNALPPAQLTYGVNPAVYTLDQTITPNVPSHAGGAVGSYSISPALPEGLSLDPTTGILSGASNELLAATDYTVTATNSIGSTIATLNITVNDMAPSQLSYAVNPAVYTLHQAIPNNMPSIHGGTVVSYAISPAPPSGLTLDTTTGILSGTPIVLSPAANYTITATNSGGSTQATLNIAVLDVPPSGLAYSPNPAAYTLNQEIADNVPSSGGGPVISYSITPPLPSGLNFDMTTGIISGTPLALSPAVDYTVVATNSGGIAHVTLNITVKDVPPSGLSYATNPAVYTVNQAIPDNIPSLAGGGAVTSYSITPTLPSGLHFDPTTGVISGTPLVAATEAIYTVTATNSGGSTPVPLTLTVNDVPPSGLSYATSPAVYTVNQAIPNNIPSLAGGTGQITWSISPALPSGLSLDLLTGVISGTPIVLSPAADYTVTATNSGGSTQVTLNITVNDVPPSNLVYSTNPAIYTVGQAIPDNTPSLGGGGPVTSYSVSPGLPSGLSFSPSTGVISGTPHELSPATDYTVTAKNSGGHAQVTLNITVNDVPPSNLTYSPNPAVYMVGQTIPDNIPAADGGTPISWSISPELPSGLSFSPSTGVISGTPLTQSLATDYTVTATNSGGHAQVTLNITVNDVPPSNLTYSTNPAVYTINQAISDNIPSLAGGGTGQITWSVSPELPSGLHFDLSTGIISGTPLVLAAAASYTVTATNSGGPAQAILSITVQDVPPSGLTYSTNPAVYTVGQAIPDNIPSLVGGGAATSWSVSPGLPSGLHFDPTTGIISSTPLVLSSTAIYTVTATNSGGSTQVPLTITVNDVPPSTLTYSPNPAVYTITQAIPDNIPSLAGGGAATSWSITPALPSGLHFDTTTGIVSGTPNVLSPATDYTVTATNSGGSTPATLTLTVKDVPPSGLTYSTNPAAYTVNQAIPNNIPSLAGGTGQIIWSISPELPSGLGFDLTTGIISGTPLVSATTASYTVTATNTGGSTSAPLTLTVNDVPVGFIFYSTNPAVYTVNQAIPNNIPSLAGGTGTISWSISPALPSGLSFSLTTGVVSGTPLAAATTASYTVTATNSDGESLAWLTLTVKDVPPTALTYSTNPATYTVNQTITNNVPSLAGGTGQITYSISQGLPSGLSFSTSTGVISGTPLAAATAASYTVTAKNSGGSTPATLTIAVKDVPPSGLTYSMNPATYTINQAIPDNIPSLTGGTGQISWSISPTPTLFSGLNFDTTTGIISGTPLEMSQGGLIAYTITATNSGGQIQTTLNIAVKDVPISNLTYSTNPAVYTINQPIPNNIPLYSGGAATYSAASGLLPPGLHMSDSPIGVISGTPTVLQPATDCTITLGNSGGSDMITVSFEVDDVPPSGLAYSTSPAVYTIGQAIPNNIPSLTGGGPVTSWSVSPALPSGLSLSSSGIISGTPTTFSPTTSYTVTATNSGGSTQTTLTITVAGTTGINDGVIAAGSQGTGALVNGGAMCWGPNFFGEIGNSSTSESNIPAQVSGLTNGVQAISVSGTNGGHTCALVNGGAMCWGVNSNGELGNGSTTDSDIPVQVSGLSNGVQSIAVGEDHACAVVYGTVECWGANNNAQLGNGLTTESHVPVQVTGLTSGVQAVSAGAQHTCALVNGGVQCWGWGGEGELGNGTATVSKVPVSVTGLTSGVQAISVGVNNMCALASGGVQCWGEIGDDPTTINSSPVSVPTLTSGVEAISAGFEQTCALVKGGVQCWGYNTYGELGTGSTTSSSIPVLVHGLATGVQTVSAGDGYTCALVNGGVQCWGDNSDGELGNGSTLSSLIPVPASGLEGGLQAIAAGDQHTCALLNDEVQCWGENTSGQLGNNSTTNSSVPVRVSGLTGGGVRAVVGGESHTCALVNGGVQCWGDNSSGQLGNNSMAASLVPVSVPTLAQGVQAIAAGNGGNHNCALLDGGVWCWGSNNNGQLGNNSTTNSLKPFELQTLTSGAQAITAGTAHTCALVNGGVKCWGSNAVGQLGTGNTTTSLVPVLVPTLASGVQAIAAGTDHTCALVNGGVWCWGSNVDGQLGNNTMTNSSVPVRVVGLAGVVRAIAAGNNHTCALVNSGIQCWGSNADGQLGNNSTTNSSEPVWASGLTTGVEAIAVGLNHTCAQVGSGVQCWGFNGHGQIGNGSFTTIHQPVLVGPWQP